MIENELTKEFYEELKKEGKDIRDLSIGEVVDRANAIKARRQSKEMVTGEGEKAESNQAG